MVGVLKRWGRGYSLPIRQVCVSRVGYPKTEPTEQGWETSSPWQSSLRPLGLYIALAAVIAAEE